MLHTWNNLDDLFIGALRDLNHDFSVKWKRDSSGEKWRLPITLPGVKRDDIELTTVEGWAKIKHPNGTLKVGIPKDADHETLEASLDLGILELEVSEKKTSGARTVKIK